MTVKPDRDLRAAVRDRGFTPGARDVAPLLELLGDADADLARGAERSLARLGPPLLPTLLVRYAAAAAPLRAGLCRLIGRVGAADAAARTLLVDALHDADARAQRAAARALGRLRDPAVEAALLDAWRAADHPALRTALAEALGKTGGARALDALRAADPGAAPDRVTGRAVLMLQRTAARAESSRIDDAVAPPVPRPLVFFCRAGLEEILVDELGAAWRPRIVARGRVEATLAGSLAAAWTARTAHGFAFPLPPVELAAAEPLADGVVRALAADDVVALLRRFTRGPIRWRLAFAGAGHRRALVWECARRVAERRPELLNDPTASTWEAVVLERRGRVYIDMFPRALDDPRFAWRVADVPAASHPPLAAALARAGGVRDGDVVWDPFVGSGAELIERARLGPCAALCGTDHDPAALAAARRNATAAGVALTLDQADAASYVPVPAPTLIVTNPPMGRRVVHHRDLGELLERFVVHAAHVLAPGGRMVWLAPRPEASARVGAAHGLRLLRDREVDLGGFTARLQVLERTRPGS